MHYEPSWVRPEAQWIAERRGVLARLGALEGPMFLLAERRPGDAEIRGWLKRLTGVPPQTPDESGAAASTNPALPNAATDDAARTALLNVGDSRLIQLEHAASNDAAKDITIHASA